MKKIFLLLLTLNFFSAYSQSAFESEADVLSYLSTKGQFTNKKANITLTFSEMGGRLSTGSSSYFNPDVTIVTSTRAYVKYQSLNNPNVKVEFIVDSKDNYILDRKDKSIFYADTDDTNENSNSNTPLSFDSQLKFIIGTFYSAELQMKVSVYKIPYKKTVTYWRNISLGNYDLQMKMFTKSGAVTILNLESGNMLSELDFSNSKGSHTFKYADYLSEGTSYYDGYVIISGFGSSKLDKYRFNKIK